MRQKTVFSDLSQIAHLWANQHQSEARNSSRNLFFNNDTIYSYGHHFPIGKHVKNNAGEYATLFTLRTYSKRSEERRVGKADVCSSDLSVIF